MSLCIPALQQSLLFFPLALGIYLSYGIFRTTDMTPEGSFVLGAAVFARLLSENFSPGISLIIAVFTGMLAGAGVGFLQKNNKMDPLIAGVLALFMLYSINFQIMGRPNISLHGYRSLFSVLGMEGAAYGIILGIVGLVTLILIFLMTSRLGLIFRAFGDNQHFLKALGKNSEMYRCLGLGLSNGLAALCGVLTAQINGYADISMGLGMTLTGIGAVVMGGQFMSRVRTPSFKISLELTGCFLGVFIYFLMLNFLLAQGINPINLKLALGVILVFFLRRSLPVSRRAL